MLEKGGSNLVLLIALAVFVGVLLFFLLLFWRKRRRREEPVD